MAWYYYSGTIVRPVPRGDGVTVAARPHTKVEIVKATPETQAMIKRGHIETCRSSHRDEGAQGAQEGRSGCHPEVHDGEVLRREGCHIEQGDEAQEVGG